MVLHAARQHTRDSKKECFGAVEGQRRFRVEGVWFGGTVNHQPFTHGPHDAKRYKASALHAHLRASPRAGRYRTDCGMITDHQNHQDCSELYDAHMQLRAFDTAGAGASSCLWRGCS